MLFVFERDWLWKILYRGDQMNYESPEVHNMFHYASSSSIMIIGLNAQFRLPFFLLAIMYKKVWADHAKDVEYLVVFNQDCGS